MRVTFHGAARQVTGSAHLVEVGGARLLLDCGLFDTNRLDPEGPNRKMTFDPRSLDAVIVSHAHNDHIGRLPCLVRAGYAGPIYCTPATADVTAIMLRDSARIQREDLRPGPRQRNPKAEANLTPDQLAAREPLFDLTDVEWVVDSTKRVDFGRPVQVAQGVTMTFHNSGHIIGSAMVQLDCVEGGRRKRFLFSGDLGRPGNGLLPDPEFVPDVDVLVTESTYGHKELDSYETLMKQLHAIVLRAIRLQSKIVIPAFSLGRTQRMVYCLQELFTVHKVRPVPVYVDSPLSLRLTDVHRDYPDAYTAQARKLMDGDPMYFGSKYVEYCQSFEESRRLNFVPGPVVIIASSGMCEAGRVRHHLRHVIGDPDNAVVIVSYQAEGTVGRQIAEGAERIQIMDEWHDLNAAVYVLDSFSGHADKNDLAWWFDGLGHQIETAFVVHGELQAMEALVPVLQTHVTGNVHIPEYLQSYEF